jgi:hypothetical protein
MRLNNSASTGVAKFSRERRNVPQTRSNIRKPAQTATVVSLSLPRLHRKVRHRLKLSRNAGAYQTSPGGRHMDRSLRVVVMIESTVGGGALIPTGIIRNGTWWLWP